MKAIILKDFGGPSQLVVNEIAQPEVTTGNVLIEIQASGVCHHDLLHRQGRLPKARSGVVLGHEASGIIREIGTGVTQRKPGDRVVIYQRRFCGQCPSCISGRHDLCKALGSPSVDTEGSYAEFISVPAVATVLLPENVSYQQAALASCPIATSLRAVHLSQLKAGETVLINGASGGLGIHQIQLAKATGARVIAVTRNASKAGFLSQWGADEVIISPDSSYSATVWKLTDKQGVNVAIDNTGVSLPETLYAMAQGGRVVVLGNINPRDVSISPGLLIGRRLTVQGSGSATLEEVSQALALISYGIIKPVIHNIINFNDVSAAHQLMETSDISGRIILQGWR
ncbi:alcohol dehydrogenase catalytic domain-containing protein [Tatumella terrea]|uniref:Alcohol dehydrogenase catalytic domain-containing protein n=1 Tax=Tatumella terrea TaxID=419007 RepID=A0ABW1VXB7_9GAMM